MPSVKYQTPKVSSRAPKSISPSLVGEVGARRPFDHAVGLLAVPLIARDGLLRRRERDTVANRRRGIEGREVRLGLDRHVAAARPQRERDVLTARLPALLPRRLDDLRGHDFSA